MLNLYSILRIPILLLLSHHRYNIVIADRYNFYEALILHESNDGHNCVYRLYSVMILLLVLL